MDDLTVLTPSPDYCLSGLDDHELLASTRRMVGRSNQVLAALLAHLAEVEARGLHRLRACSSLYTYCVYELRMSEDAALRRAHAARFARRFPVLFERIAAGEIHLTGLLMLGPHLTDENHLEVLARAKHRTKRELAVLVRMLDPLPSVPGRVEPLGPEPTGKPLSNPTWQALTGALTGPVRELSPGDRPQDWVSSAESCAEVRHQPDQPEQPDQPCEPAGEPFPRGAQRYKVEFTARDEYVSLLNQARDLLAHAESGRSLEAIHLRAMRLLVADLKKRKYAKTEQPRPEQPAEPHADPRQRGRHIPAQVRRQVAARDGERCSFVDDRGQRCRETSGLEMHHDHAFALGGAAAESNLSLRCKAHNALAAEQDFGRDFMERKKGSRGLEPAPARHSWHHPPRCAAGSSRD